MAEVSRSLATLRISGEELDPQQITELLGGTPTTVQKKGNVIIGKKTDSKRVVRFGMWRLVAAERSPQNLNEQVEEILGQLTEDIVVWEKLGKQFKLDLFCGIFMDHGNEGMTISSKTLLALGQRGIELDLDIYGPSDEVSDQDGPEAE